MTKYASPENLGLKPKKSKMKLKKVARWVLFKFFETHLSKIEGNEQKGQPELSGFET